MPVTSTKLTVKFPDKDPTLPVAVPGAVKVKLGAGLALPTYAVKEETTYLLDLGVAMLFYFKPL